MIFSRVPTLILRRRFYVCSEVREGRCELVHSSTVDPELVFLDLARCFSGIEDLFNGLLAVFGHFLSFIRREPDEKVFERIFRETQSCD